MLISLLLKGRTDQYLQHQRTQPGCCLFQIIAEKQADIVRLQLEQKPTPYDDIQISSTYFRTSVTVIPPGIHGDRDVITFKGEGTHVSINKVEKRPQNVGETFENQNPVSHCIPTPEDNQNDIPSPVPAHVMSQ